MALYVYGFMRASDAERAANGAARATAASVEVVEHEGLAALVSPASERAIRLSRQSVVAHSDVLQAAFECGPVLPLRLGTVLADQAAVAGYLLEVGRRLGVRLEALEGKAEMRVKAVYGEQELLRAVLAGDRALARAAQRIQSLPPAAAHFERISLGEAIAAAVETRRAADQQALVGELAPLAVAVSVLEPAHERSAMNAAFLVERDRLEDFDATVERVSESRAPEMSFRLIGPLPPYSFADREWETTEKELGAWA